MSSKRRLPTDAQAAAMRNLRAAKPTGYGLVGRSAHGGHTKVRVAIRSAGWAILDAIGGQPEQITADGEAALDAYDAARADGRKR